MSQQHPLPATTLIHLTYEGNFQLECDATLLSCQFVDDPKSNDDTLDQTIEIQLDRTVMHPQGGGQPTDIGVVLLDDNPATTHPGSCVRITRVTMDRTSGIVTHAGTLSRPASDSSTLDGVTWQPHVGQSVTVKVDPDQRSILSECHTAGHVVDAAMAHCGRILPPIKGYHFLDGPYVEYKGTIPPEEREELLANLQRAFSMLVDQDIPTKIETMSNKDFLTLNQQQQQQQQQLDKNDSTTQFLDSSDFGGWTDEIRIVTVAGWSCPCGGTHVPSTGHLLERKWGIVGIKCKKGVVRIRYDQNCNSNPS